MSDYFISQFECSNADNRHFQSNTFIQSQQFINRLDSDAGRVNQFDSQFAKRDK